MAGTSKLIISNGRITEQAHAVVDIGVSSPGEIFDLCLFTVHDERLRQRQICLIEPADEFRRQISSSRVVVAGKLLNEKGSGTIVGRPHTGSSCIPYIICQSAAMMRR